MRSTDLMPGRVYDLPTTHSNNADYFVVRTDDGKEFNIKKLKFQKEQPAPTKISCLVKSVHDDHPIVVMDLIPYVNQFYEEGGEYTFRVKADYTRSNFYEVEDENGLYFRLPANGVVLSVGQSVDCKVVKINGWVVQLKLLSTNRLVREIPFWPISVVKDKVFFNGSFPIWLCRFILSDESEPLREQYASNDARWLINAINYFIEKIPTWFDGEEQLDYEHAMPRLHDLLHASQTLLERSDYLAKCSDNERQAYRKQLSDMTASIRHFIRACSMIEVGDHEEFIDQMFSNLKLSGYLYNPDKQFHTLNAILRIHPQFIHEWMGQIFDALTSWNIQNWKMEPFRSAFVRQTELYIRENQHEADELVSFNSKSNNAIISKMIMALAIQMLIVDNQKDDVNIDRNRAMFYRYISYLNNGEQNALFDKALLCILGGRFKPEFTWEHLRQLEMLITLSGVKNSVTIPENTLKTYSNENNYLEISSRSILLRHGAPKNLRSILPNSLQLWQGIQIFADEKSDVRVPSASKLNDLNAYKAMWADINHILFPQNVQPVREVRKSKPGVGDEVRIRVDKVEHTPDDRSVCTCTVVDEVYEGCGLLSVRNIVRFNCDPSIYDFYDDDTSGKMIFKATVQSVDSEGLLSFSLLDQVDRCIVDNIEYGDESTCVITNKFDSTFMCLSEFGYSVIVQRDKSTESYDVGHFVNISITESSVAGRIRGDILGRVSDEERFHPTLPFHNIMQYLRVDVEEVEDEGDENENIIQAEETITYEQVDELIAIIRRLAFSSADYVQAYNYLGFASVLARLVSDEALESICNEHMELLILLQAFAKNRKIDMAELEKHSFSAPCNPMLNLLYTRLSVVSNIGRPEYNQKLWEMLQTAGSEEDANLIRKVLTFNLMKQSGDEEKAMQNAVLEQIGHILNVNFYQSKLKFYGTESQYVEFKTSIVYPADSKMKPDAERQNHEIASIICGFLNADGGTLYIGVNDQGYESGVGDDMDYYKVTNLDKYILKIEELINRQLGSTANDYIEIEVDRESKHNVVAVSIKPSLRVISVKPENLVYVRHTTSTRPKVGEDLEIFEKDRKIRYQQIELSLLK